MTNTETKLRAALRDDLTTRRRIMAEATTYAVLRQKQEPSRNWMLTVRTMAENYDRANLLADGL